MKKIKKAIRGYSPSAARRWISELQEHHQISMNELREQARLREEELRQLQNQLDSLAEEEKKQPAMLSEQAAARRLLEAHVRQTEKIWALLEDLRAEEERRRSEAGLKLSERDRMLEHAESRLKETLEQLKERRDGM